SDGSALLTVSGFSVGGSDGEDATTAGAAWGTVPAAAAWPISSPVERPESSVGNARRSASDSAHLASMRSGILPHMDIGLPSLAICTYDSQRATAHRGSLKSSRRTPTLAAAGGWSLSQTSFHTPSGPHQNGPSCPA